jgi:hypothetical protein
MMSGCCPDALYDCCTALEETNGPLLGAMVLSGVAVGACLLGCYSPQLFMLMMQVEVVLVYTHAVSNPKYIHAVLYLSLVWGLITVIICCYLLVTLWTHIGLLWVWLGSGGGLVYLGLVSVAFAITASEEAIANDELDPYLIDFTYSLLTRSWVYLTATALTKLIHLTSIKSGCELKELRRTDFPVYSTELVKSAVFAGCVQTVLLGVLSKAWGSSSECLAVAVVEQVLLAKLTM